MMRLKSTLLLSLFTLAFCVGAQAADTSAPVAKIGDVTLTQDQMDKDLGPRLYEIQNQLYELQKSWIDSKAANVLFDRAAKDAGLSRKQWQDQEISSKTPAPTQQEVQQAVSQAYHGTSVTSDTLKSAMNWLTQEKEQQRAEVVYAELQKKYPVQVLVSKPVAPIINVTYSKDDPIKGPANAPVTIVEFTDFQCPYCRKSQGALLQVEQAYGDKIKWVARQYPLPFHNRAKPSAEAALCANEQGKYWAYRDKLFGVDRKAPVTDNGQIPPAQLEDADFKRFAKDVGLNASKFDKCVADHRYAARVEKDIADGQKFGVNGTPSFFINGVEIVGSQPFQTFKEDIDTALAKK